MTQNYDIVIIGGGIIGNSICAHLAKNNSRLNILLVNSTDLGTPASIAAAGLLTPFQLEESENPKLKEFCFKSFEYFPKFVDELLSNLTDQNLDLGYKNIGSLYIIFSNYEIAKKEKSAPFLNKHEVLKLEPNITKEIVGAYYYQSEGIINNPKFLKAISQYCINKKISFLNSQVSEINISKSKIENIKLNNGETIHANKYVLCNGAWANNFLKKIFNTKENIIEAIKGEIMQVRAPQELPLQRIIFCSEGYILPRYKTNQFEESSILVGSTSSKINIEENHSIFKNTLSGISHLTNLFQKLFPACKDFPILNFWSGLRPKTKDGLPIITKPSEVSNLYLALGHYRNGILMGPYTGKILSDLILDQEVEYDIGPFSMERFLYSKARSYTNPTK